MKWWKRLFAKDWQKSRQEEWWYAACIHADNSPLGTPMWARKVWDDIVKISPKAPEHIRPFYVMKSGGRSLLRQDFIDEIRERTKKGYRVIYVLKKGDFTDLERDLSLMAEQGSLPWGVSLWNELDLGKKYSPSRFKEYLEDNEYKSSMKLIIENYNIKVAPPAFASFNNALGEYGEVINELWEDIPQENKFLMLHSYGRLQPKYWADYNLPYYVRLNTGIEEVIIAECANAFAGENYKEDVPPPGVVDIQGADFLMASMSAAKATKTPMCPFMLYHRKVEFNNISHATHGEMRRAFAKTAIEELRKGHNIPYTLINPKGKEIDGHSKAVRHDLP